MWGRRRANSRITAPLTPHRQFLRLVRLTVVWIAISWLLFTIQNSIDWPLRKDVFTPPTPPFESVTTQDKAAPAQTHETIQLLVRHVYSQIVQAWWYNGMS